MRKKLSFTMTAIAAIILATTSCKKDLSLKQSKPNLETISKINTDSVALTPAGWLPKAHIFIVAPGHMLSITNGHMLEVEKTSGKLVKDLGIRQPVANTSKLRVQSITGKPSPAVPDGSGNWIAFSDWYNSSSTPISYFSTNWVVPPAPLASAGQTIFLFNGLESNSLQDILQPVLQWGASHAGGGAYWSIANWYVWASGSATYAAVQMPLIQVAVGTNLQGVMKLTGQQSYGSANYTSEFIGYNNKLTLTQGAVINQSDAAIPFINQQTFAFETLEAYDNNNQGAPPPNQATEYPNTDFTAMTNIQIKLGTTNAPLSWTPVDNITTFGQHAVIINNSSTNGEVDLYYRRPPPPLPTININGKGSYDWFNGNGSGSGSINAPAGTLVHVTISAYGPGTLTNFIMSGATLSGPMGNNVTMQNNSTTQTFTMPASGSVTWSGHFQRTSSSGTGDIAVN